MTDPAPERSMNQPDADVTGDPVLSLRTRAIKGSAWWSGSFVLLNILQLVSNIVLAWLLTPAAFGVVALADIVMRGMATVSDVGIRPAVVQNERSDQAFLDTAWTIQIIRGAIIFAGACALAWPAAYYYETTLLLYILPATGLMAFGSSFHSTQFWRLNRSLQEAPRVILRFNEQLLARSSMIMIALVSPTPWALVLGNAVGNVYFTIRSHGLSKGPRHHLRMEPDAVMSLVNFGRWVLIGSLIVFVSREIDKLMLGKIVNEQMATLGLLGVYVLANRLASVPVEGIRALAGQVSFPILAETAREAPAQFTPRLLRIRRIILLPAMVGSLGIIWFSPVFFDWLYDDRYAAAMWMTPLISVSVWVTLLNGLVSRSLLALGQVKTLAWTGLLNAAGTTAGALLGYRLLGIPGFIVGLSMGSIVKHVTELLILRRAEISVWRQDLAYTILFAVVAAVGAAPRWFEWSSLPRDGQAVLAIVLPAVLLTLIGSVAFSRLWREVFSK